MLSELQHAHIAKLLGGYCEARIPQEVRDRVRLGFRITGHAVELFESRPAFRAPHEWRDHGIAKFRYVASRKVCRLYCQFRDVTWHEYEPRPEAGSLDELLAEVDRDPTGIFWG